MIGYNFSERVRKILIMAREEASRMRHEYVGTEHLLFGLIREGGGVAATVLENLSIDPDAVRQKLEETVEKGTGGRSAATDLPYTSRAKKVLELAMKEAEELHHSYVGAEHLLLGLLREDKGIAAQVLHHFGAELETARQETVRLLGSPSPTQPRTRGADPPSIATVRACRPIRFTVQVDCEGGAWFGERFERVADAIAYLRGLDTGPPGADAEPPPPQAAT